MKGTPRRVLENIVCSDLNTRRKRQTTVLTTWTQFTCHEFPLNISQACCSFMVSYRFAKRKSPIRFRVRNAATATRSYQIPRNGSASQSVGTPASFLIGLGVNAAAARLRRARHVAARGRALSHRVMLLKNRRRHFSRVIRITASLNVRNPNEHPSLFSCFHFSEATRLGLVHFMFVSKTTVKF